MPRKAEGRRDLKVRIHCPLLACGVSHVSFFLFILYSSSGIGVSGFAERKLTLLDQRTAALLPVGTAHLLRAASVNMDVVSSFTRISPHLPPEQKATPISVSAALAEASWTLRCRCPQASGERT